MVKMTFKFEVILFKKFVDLFISLLKKNLLTLMEFIPSDSQSLFEIIILNWS